jgi:MoxR-like ATPase
MTDPQRVAAAAGRFRAFFAELSQVFFEREDVIHQIALALLSRQHALVTGPPGTAKSALASAVFGRIVCEESGEPSLYARQITESTVQTDLIGPIDFKNLMETGRTTHFTDEGMLGAVHAFLDEVFDGRDMLLRSALNVLQERELKQGGTITRGRIECALMTSNRYIADVIENARETLLAFVDRIAFISFVPRSFAKPENMQRVLSRHVARAAQSRLDALLTIQDLDVLQEQVQAVVVAEPICDALAALLGSLDAELNQAARSDPQFVPTRYLSTRTAVRSGEILRAQCVYDRIFRDGDRELLVMPVDLAALRLHLLLGGPLPDEVEALIAREADPNERRQLEIIRTEREIFDRCLAKLPKIKPNAIAAAIARQAREVEAPEAAAPARANDEAQPEKHEPALPSDVPSLLQLIRALATAAASAPDAAAARSRLESAVGRLNEIAFRAALSAAAEPGEELLGAIDKLVALAETIGHDTVSVHALSSFLRGKADEMVRAASRLVAGASQADLDGSGATARAERRIDLLERLDALRRRIRSTPLAGDHDDAAWREALEAGEEDIAALWDAAFCQAVEERLAAAPAAPLSELLSAIAPELAWLDEATERLERLRGAPSSLKRQAIGGRLADLVGARLAGLDEVDRATLHHEIERALGVLAPYGLGNAIPPIRWITWCASAMTRSLPAVGPVKMWDFDGYHALRKGEQRVPVAYTLCEVAFRVAPELSNSGEVCAGDLGRVSQLFSQLPDDLGATAARADLERIKRAVAYLERWWELLAAGDMPAGDRLEMVVRSRLFKVLWDDMALARFLIEAQIVADVFTAAAPAARALIERIEALQARTRRGAFALLRQRTDSAWKAAVAQGQG